MAVISLGFHNPDTGALIGTLDDSQAEIELRPALYELGAISITVSRHLAAASTALLKSGNLVAVTILQVDADPIWGAVLKDDAADLLSRQEQGGEHLTLTGPGLLEVLRHARLLEETYAPVPPASEERGSSDVEGVWFWQSQPYGAIFSRAIEEGQHQPGTPLGLVDKDFGRTLDSDGIAWDTIQQDYQLRTGTDLLTVSDTLAQAGDFYPVAVPVVTAGTMRIALSAHQDVGRSLNGAFGAGTVRFEKGVNILTELQRKRKHTRMTHLLTRNMDGDYALHVTPAAYDAAVVGFLDVGQTNDAAHVAKVAQTALVASDTDAEEFTLEVTPGVTPASGTYLPGPIGSNGHFWPGDYVTLHTGATGHDLNASIQRVVAVSIVVDVASSDADATKQARSLRIVPELSFRNVRGMAGNNPEASVNASPGCCVNLCGPTIPGTSATVLADWKWNDPGGASWDYHQDVAAQPSLGQGSFQMANASGASLNANPWYRSQPAGRDLPHPGRTDAAQFLPCAVGTPITIEMDIAHRSFNAGGVTVAEVHWYTAGAGEFAEFATSAWVNGTGYGSFTHVSQTFNPPAGAVKFTLFVQAYVDNVLITTGTGTATQNPHGGTGDRAARCDHTHPATEHDHDLDYAMVGHVHDEGDAVQHYEVLMADGITSPPDPVTTDDGTDWVYGWVS